MIDQTDLMLPTDAAVRARALTLRYGWNSTSYQLLNPGFTLWFSKGHDALVGYVQAGRTRVVGGAPVCAEEALREVALEFEQDAATAGHGVCYFAAEERLESVHRSSRRHSRFLLGAQPVWRPQDWPQNIATHASLRAQCRRAHHKGVTVAHWPRERAHRHPALVACLQAWLSTRGLPPLHFLIEPNTLGVLDDREVFVAERDEKPVGFVIASPITARNGWLVEQFVRDPAAPNGTVELMLDTAVRWMESHGANYMTLGLAPLSRHANEADAQSDPLWLRRIFSAARKYGGRWYNFDGLDAFKAKYRPMRWDPVYAISTEPSVSLKTLTAIAVAFGLNNSARTVG